ncbi:MAG: Pfs, and Ankyrin domain protein [Candidatus Midichloriaceae bacterium]|jgi:ankyrin repeat protein|nr:Pfs, and Ankyrin domain protein [Candidatus Midichloriaceae bacterium]
MKRNPEEELGHASKKVKIEHKASFESIHKEYLMHIKFLLESGADIDVNLLGFGSCTPLHCACEDLDAEMVKLLLERGANPNTTYENCGNDMGTPMIFAIKSYLYKYGHHPFNQNEAVQNEIEREIEKQIEFFKLKNIVNLLLQYGASLDIISVDLKCIPLFIAVRHLDIQLTEFLLDKGADPNIQVQKSTIPRPFLHDPNDEKYAAEGTTLLNFALILHSSESIIKIDDYNNKIIVFAKLLLSKGANPNIIDSRGLGALDCVLYAYRPLKTVQEELIKLLLENGANPNLLNDYNKTPLLSSVIVEKLSFTKILLKAGGNPNLKNSANQIILQSLIEYPSSELKHRKNEYLHYIKTLLKYGADPALLDDKNSYIYPELIELLKLLPHSLAVKFPEAKSCTQIGFQIKNICKTVRLFNLVCKDGFGPHAYLPEDAVYLIGSFCSNVSASTFAVVVEELKSIDVQIISFKERVKAVFSSLEEKAKELGEAAVERPI